MNITLHRFNITERHTLTISRGTSAGSENLRVEVEHDGITGLGEMAPTSGGAAAETADATLHDWLGKHSTIERNSVTFAIALRKFASKALLVNVVQPPCIAPESGQQLSVQRIQ